MIKLILVFLLLCPVSGYAEFGAGMATGLVTGMILADSSSPASCDSGKVQKVCNKDHTKCVSSCVPMSPAQIKDQYHMYHMFIWVGIAFALILALLGGVYFWFLL